KPLGRNDDSGLALNGLRQKSACVGSDGFAEGARIAEGNDFESRSERAKAIAILLVGGEADDGDGASVEIIGADNNLGLVLRNALDLVTPLASRLDRGFDGLGA